MDQFQILEKLQSECLLFIDKGYHEKVIPGYTFTFFITQPVAKEVNFLFFISLNRPLGRFSLVVAISSISMKV